MTGQRRFVPVGQWVDRRQRRGLAGELAVLEYLVSRGWEIEAHRFRHGRHDVDLVVRRDNLIAFVEVKTRRSSVCGAAVESVSMLKRRILGRVATLWRVRYGRAGDRYRFDVAAVRDLGGGRFEVEQVEDAWRLEWSAC
ncbi:MAG: YraN family protein [Gemmatimonadales bacterium]|nr:YraN family protein [Gemmatimonadales bacterium]